MTPRSLRHRRTRPTRVRRVRPAPRTPGMIQVTVQTTTGGLLVSESFLIMNGRSATAHLRGYEQTADGFSYLTVPVTVSARVA